MSNSEVSFKCPFCPCVFSTAVDLNLHLERFGRDEVSHYDIFCSVHSDEACLAYYESLHGGADRVVREIAQIVGGKRKRARLRKVKVTNKDKMELTADSSVSSGTCE